MSYTATYSPEDNKLRLYASARLDKELYQRVRNAGFIWAPKQDLFVAPAWTPGRADFLEELAGEIEDEDKSLVDRAEERADRFGDYSDKRANEAQRARAAVSALSDGIPLGQPILIGHHSERRARKDAEKIENGMRRALGLWETSEYWTSRAAGALAHARYKELPAVRARRIKTIEADKRKQERTMAEAVKYLESWTKCEAETDKEKQFRMAVEIANVCWLHLPRKEGDRPDFNQSPTAYDALMNSHPTLYAPRTIDEVFTAAARVYPRTIEFCERWINHYNNRLAYERAMLGEQGGIASDVVKPEKGGGCQCWASPRGGWSYIQKVNKVSVTVLDNWGNGGGNFTRTIPFDKLASMMSAAQVVEARAQGEIIDTADGTGFILKKPRPDTEEAKTEAVAAKETPAADPGEDFDKMRDSLRAGVQVVAAPQLFPTSREVAAQMVDYLELVPGLRVLEPSAGTGVLLQAMPGVLPFPHANRQTFAHVVAVEYSRSLADGLTKSGLASNVYCADFLEWEPEGVEKFDRVIMNPPFVDGADIKHIQRALTWLQPGGRLVAICADGPRQREKLQPLADHWEELPADAFAHAGTNVRAALLIINK